MTRQSQVDAELLDAAAVVALTAEGGGPAAPSAWRTEGASALGCSLLSLALATLQQRLYPPQQPADPNADP